MRNNYTTQTRAHRSLAMRETILWDLRVGFLRKRGRGQQPHNQLLKEVSVELTDDLVQHIRTLDVRWGGAVSGKVPLLPAAVAGAADASVGPGAIHLHGDWRGKGARSRSCGWSRGSCHGGGEHSA